MKTLDIDIIRGYLLHSHKGSIKCVIFDHLLLLLVIIMDYHFKVTNKQIRLFFIIYSPL